MHFKSPFDFSSYATLLFEAMGLLQHHDAVSGTEKQHVAYDYARHLAVGGLACDSLMSAALNQLLGSRLDFVRCPYLNESLCPITQTGVCVCACVCACMYVYLCLPAYLSVCLSVSAPSFSLTVTHVFLA